jgi:hypothetical protein
MLRKLLIILLFASPMAGFGQEHIFIHTDKKICSAGDTIWLRAYLPTDSATKGSVSFFVEIYDDQEILIRRDMFPVTDHVGIGQVAAPSIPGNYWLRGYTRNSSSQAFVPVNVLSADRPAIIRSYSSSILDTAAQDRVISIRQDGEDYVIQIADTISCNYSLAVTDTTDPGTASMLSFPAPKSFQRSWDTLGLVFRARLKGRKKRRNKDGAEMLVYFRQDSVTSPIQLIPLDSTGTVVFPGMFFFNTGFFHYQFNLKDNANPGVPELISIETGFPAFTPPAPSVYRTDIIRANMWRKPAMNSSAYLRPSIKQLKQIDVKGRWIDRHLALNKQYVMSKEFAPIEHFTFDLRDPMNPGGIYSVLEYLYRELPPSWYTGTLLSCREGVQFYVDEQLVNAQILATRTLSEFAYAKVYQDLHPPCPAICLYTRKGNDLNSLPSAAGMLALKGYEKPLSWTGPDRITWLWEPFLTANSYRIHVPAKSFKVVLLGTTTTGEAIKFERTVREGHL